MQTFWWFEWYDDGTMILACPVCGDTYQHHAAVEEFRREHEDGPTTVYLPGVAGGESDRFNPSSRRGAVRIQFWGECGHAWHLDVIQHKGQTLVEVGTDGGPCPS